MEANREDADMTETLIHIIALAAAWDVGRDNGWTGALDLYDQGEF